MTAAHSFLHSTPPRTPRGLIPIRRKLSQQIESVTLWWLNTKEWKPEYRGCTALHIVTYPRCSTALLCAAHQSFCVRDCSAAVSVADDKETSSGVKCVRVTLWNVCTSTLKCVHINSEVCARHTVKCVRVTLWSVCTSQSDMCARHTVKCVHVTLWSVCTSHVINFYRTFRVSFYSIISDQKDINSLH